MTHTKDITYLGGDLKPHHRLFIAIVILLSLFVPVFLATIFSVKTSETGNISRTPKHLKASLFSNTSAVDAKQLQSAPIVPDPVIDLSEIVASHNSQDKSFGISIVELGGKNRRGDYNGDQIFVSASTYKLFTAYSTLIRVEDGRWSWSDVDIYDSKDLLTCFNDMIVFSDNDCAEALMALIGYQTVTDEAYAIGCDDTTFISSDGYAKTTANDLALFLTKLYKGQILSQQSSRDLLINAMKDNVYQEGIPAGLGDDIVADKVGFIDSYLNDAAIVYDSRGNFVLVIMTNNSSWPEIASLASEINLLRQQ